GRCRGGGRGSIRRLACGRGLARRGGARRWRVIGGPGREGQQTHDQGGRRQKPGQHALPPRDAARRYRSRWAKARPRKALPGFDEQQLRPQDCAGAGARLREWLSVGTKKMPKPRGKTIGQSGMETRWKTTTTSLSVRARRARCWHRG